MIWVWKFAPGYQDTTVFPTLVSKCLRKFEYVKYSYLEPYWSQPPVFHLNIRHSVKAGVHLKQKTNLKFKSSNKLSKTYIKGMLWKMDVFVINLNSKNYQKNFKGISSKKILYFFRAIYSTNEQGYDQFDHIWRGLAIVPRIQHSWQNFYR